LMGKNGGYLKMKAYLIKRSNNDIGMPINP
jgi:hypothetical protein